ncbi:hypothetical protein [Paenibacillus sp. NPDC057967]|uniref:hypothetical protein n=1 Tax=Paenibacillus sp. NPDC057967 TaxID=3346293 RepID=UPI0036DC577B
MSEEKRDIQELKQQIHALEKQVQTLKNTSKGRSSVQNFFLAFVIVFVVVLISIGVVHFINQQ